MSRDKSTEPRINLDSLLSKSAYITSVQQFLNETDYLKALTYWLSEFTPVEQLKEPEDIIDAIQRSISDIDHMINDQVNEIIHNKSFQKLESSWRGLWYLAVQADGTKNIKIKLFNATWSELSRDVARALEFDQSQLFQKVYNEEYGSPGGEPYGVLIGDYEISHKPSREHKHDDLATLEGISQVAAASFSPFITGASPELFGLDDFSTLGNPLNLHSIFAQKEYIKWRAFRDKKDSQFVGLTMPRILMRLPYRKTPGSYKGMFFYEQVSSHNRENYCWGNAAYGFAGIMIREFANVGWFGHIRGVPRNQIGGGLLTNLPCDVFETDAEDIANKPVTDVIITDIRERELSDLGFVPLCQCYNTPFAAFYGNQSTHKPKRQSSHEGEVNARLSAMLQHVLCGARVAHYIKVMIRDKVGSFTTADECEDFLRNWLFKYTTGREDLEWEEQARYPLREAAVRVKEHPVKPGEFVCVIHLRPHYQLDNMVSELELVTELAQSA
ncbi:MAG: type VI secretion system contractile sheath large subunit [endosymbiont of Galathealinum brachiosum]|uniref:Type VI secretion system contractile sheath large subunit n=1 Tax=endosymbiont of Galathealinum brachiosum TaxID=2200906 RepID=A0A370DG82_9GAMM|nr:MAG: type VI secretion system contractile sheath large subunit [endosymbiont of Galathealinum brachiosum]